MLASIYAGERNWEEKLGKDFLYLFTIQGTSWETHHHDFSLLNNRDFGCQNPLVEQIREIFGSFKDHGEPVQLVLRQKDTPHMYSDFLNVWQTEEIILLHTSTLSTQRTNSSRWDRWPSHDERPQPNQPHFIAFLDTDTYVTSLGFGLVAEDELAVDASHTPPETRRCNTI